ncbi:MAG: SufS family cysteine desulfurase, partial [Pirellulales bacterium]|nr:SufS family cysteine desulfurase [Pirellulales bacterium]
MELALKRPASVNRMPREDSFDIEDVRRDFPILAREVHGHPLVYLDNAATTQKPQAVIDTIVDYYTSTNANVHRGVHRLSVDATRLLDNARFKVKSFLNAGEVTEIVFIRGATEGINLVASTLGPQLVGADDEVLITEMEHHSNIVPWQVLCDQQGARLRVAPIDDSGQLDWNALEQLVNRRTRLVAVGHVSNALGTVNPVRQIVDLAHRHGAVVLVDGAQAAAHMTIDVQELGCDFYVISGHKLYGPTGIGALYGRRELLEQMPPYQTGGDMISSVTFEHTVYNTLPHKFEAGTPDIAGTIGLGAAIDYLGGLDWPAVCAHEEQLLDYATDALASIGGLQIVGTANDKRAVVSFTLDGVHPHDIGTIL